LSLRLGSHLRRSFGGQAGHVFLSLSEKVDSRLRGNDPIREKDTLTGQAGGLRLPRCAGNESVSPGVGLE